MATGPMPRRTDSPGKGFKRAFGKQVLLFGMTENVGHFNNSPEIGFHLGLTRMF